MKRQLTLFISVCLWQLSVASAVFAEINAPSLDSIPLSSAGKVAVYDTGDIPFNADTVYIAQLPLKNPSWEVYSYCVGVYAYKRNRPPLIIKCFFTDKSIRKAPEILSDYFKTIRYREDEHWRFDVEKERKTRLELYKTIRDAFLGDSEDEWAQPVVREKNSAGRQ